MSSHLHLHFGQQGSSDFGLKNRTLVFARRIFARRGNLDKLELPTATADLRGCSGSAEIHVHEPNVERETRALLPRSLLPGTSTEQDDGI